MTCIDRFCCWGIPETLTSRIFFGSNAWLKTSKLELVVVDTFNLECICLCNYPAIVHTASHPRLYDSRCSNPHRHTYAVIVARHNVKVYSQIRWDVHQITIGGVANICLKVAEDVLVSIS